MSKTVPIPRRRGRPSAPSPVVRVTMSLDADTIDRLAVIQGNVGTDSLSATVRYLSKIETLLRPGKAARKKS